MKNVPKKSDSDIARLIPLCWNCGIVCKDICHIEAAQTSEALQDVAAEGKGKAITGYLKKARSENSDRLSELLAFLGTRRQTLDTRQS